MAAALAFLERNNLTAVFDWQELYRIMIEIAERRCGKEALAKIFRDAFPPGAGGVE
jgi:death-on-curing protein